MFLEIYASLLIRLAMIEEGSIAPAFLAPDKRKVFTEKFGGTRNKS